MREWSEINVIVKTFKYKKSGLDGMANEFIEDDSNTLCENLAIVLIGI